MQFERVKVLLKRIISSYTEVLIQKKTISTVWTIASLGLH